VHYIYDRVKTVIDSHSKSVEQGLRDACRHMWYVLCIKERYGMPRYFSVQVGAMTDEHEITLPLPRPRRVRRRRKRSLKSRIRRVLKSSGTDKKLYLVVAGVMAAAAAVFFYDLLILVFPSK
jgi:hypothetical protein